MNKNIANLNLFRRKKISDKPWQTYLECNENEQLVETVNYIN